MKAQVKYIVEQNHRTHVVLPIADYEALLEHVDRAEHAANDISMSTPKANGNGYIPTEVVQRIIDGEPPVRVWREYRELTVDELASAANVSKDLVIEVETKSHANGLDTVKAVAEAMDIEVSLLV